MTSTATAPSASVHSRAVQATRIATAGTVEPFVRTPSIACEHVLAGTPRHVMFGPVGALGADGSGDGSPQPAHARIVRIAIRTNRRIAHTLRRGRGRGQCGSAAEDDDLARELRQPFYPPRRRVEQDQVLDPDAGLVLEVDPRLHREDRR